MTLYIVSELWTDYLENAPLAASGYRVVGVVSDNDPHYETIKTELVKQERLWPLMGKPTRRFHLQELHQYNYDPKWRG